MKNQPGKISVFSGCLKTLSGEISDYIKDQI